MSIPITVFIPKRSPKWTAKDLNAKLAAHGFLISVDDFNPRTHTGYLPASYDGRTTGFEYFREPIETYLESVEEMRESEPDDFPYSNEDLSRVRASAEIVQLVTHSSFRARAAAVIVASCLAELTGGWVLDEPVWKWYDSKNAVSWACRAAGELEPQFKDDDDE